MQPDYSKTAFLKFLTFVEDKGLVGRSTAQGWRVAAGKILDDLSASESADLRQLDVAPAFRRFANKNAGDFTPKTLSEYRKRAKAAIDNFVTWVGAPDAYEPKGRTAPGKSSQSKGSDTRPKATSGQRAHSERTEGPVVGSQSPAEPTMLSLPYPIRAGVLAHISVPRDMKAEEAKRLGAFLMTLATDFKAPD